LWAISLYLNIGSALRKLFLLRQKMAGVKTSEEGTRKLEKLKREQYINLVQVIDRVAT